MNEDERVLRIVTLEAGIDVILQQLKTAAGDLLRLCGDDPLYAARRRRALVIRAMVVSLEALGAGPQPGELDRQALYQPPNLVQPESAGSVGWAGTRWDENSERPSDQGV